MVRRSSADTDDYLALRRPLVHCVCDRELSRRACALVCGATPSISTVSPARRQSFAAVHRGGSSAQRLGADAADAERHVGVAAAECFGSHIALVAEVASIGGSLRVAKMWCAVDCGVVINPDGAAAQIEGGILFGLTAALHGQITIADGAVRRGQLRQLPFAAHRRDAGHRNTVHSIGGRARRLGRARRAGCRTRRGKRPVRGDSHARPQAAVRL